MKKFKNHTLKEYLDVLSAKKSVPGGGSAAAMTAALGVGLLEMTANYSLGKGKSKMIERKLTRMSVQCGEIRQRLLDLVDLDAEAYMRVVKARGGTAREKQAAHRAAARTPKEICRLCYKAVQLAPYLVQEGNPYLVSDVECGVEMLMAGFNAAMINVEINT